MSKKFGSKYWLTDDIGHGSFGSVYAGIKQLNGKSLAFKIECITSKQPLLHTEYKLNQLIDKKSKNRITPKIYDFLRTKNKMIMVMQKMNRDLSYINPKKPNHTNSFEYFSIVHIKYVLTVYREIIILFDNLHRCGIVHRDIKPSNFMWDYNNTLYIVDLGLSTMFIDDKNKHIKFIKKTGKYVGTMKFMSINAQKGGTASRKDDLIASFYMLIYFTKGYLPWCGKRFVGDTRNKKAYRRSILKKKKSVTLDELCDDLPEIFHRIGKIIFSLDFYEKPAYKKLVRMIDNFN